MKTDILFFALSLIMERTWIESKHMLTVKLDFGHPLHTAFCSSIFKWSRPRCLQSLMLQSMIYSPG